MIQVLCFQAGLGLAAAALIAAAGSTSAQAVPFAVQSGLIDTANTNTVGVSPAPGTETFNIFKATNSTDHYSNGAGLIGFKGYLYCMWQSSPTNEDSPDTWVAYSRSEDGASWTAPMVLAANPGDGARTSGGWWMNGDTLIAFINHWPTSLSPRAGYTEYITSTNGLDWTSIQRVKMANGTDINAVFEQDPHALPDGRIINGAHFQPGLNCSPIYTDDPSGTSGWVRAAFTNLSFNGSQTRELEPSWYRRSDGAVVMVFRDQNSTYRQLASVSTNSGQNWTLAVTNGTLPDSRAKQCAGNLPDGTAYMVNNPISTAVVKTRRPLVLTRSRTGSLFDKAYLLRSYWSLPPQRYSGTAKTLGFSYPKATIWNGYLYVGYSVNKEDMECTRVPLTSLQTVGLGEPTVVQAEAGDYGDGVTVDNNNTGYNGTGFANFPTTGGYLVFSNLNGGTGGQCVLTIRFAIGSTNARTGNLVVNGVTQPITFPGTGTWTAWTSMDVFVTLTSGSTNIIRFEATGQGVANIDEIAITPSTVTNVEPILAAISNSTINVGVSLSITNNATDADVGQTLTYSLPAAPTNATIDSANGILNWRPLVTQADTTNAFSVVVTDNGTPSMSATQSFRVFVNPLMLPSITTTPVANGQIELNVNGQVGPDYAVQGSSNLVDWHTLFITNPPTMPFNWSTNTGTLPVQFFRIKVGPPLP